MFLTTPYSLLQSNKTGDTLLSSSNENDLVSDSPVQPARDGEWIDEQDNVVENPKAKACAPSDWKTNSQKYHKINIAIWQLWITFYIFLISQITVHGETIDPSHICGPWLPWHLPPGAKYVILILRYMPTSLANMIKGRHPSAATYANGALVSATWQLLHLSLGKAYWSCAKMNIIFCAFKYRGKLTDVYSPTTILNIMVEWSKFVMGVFSIEGIMIQICSRGVITDIIKHIFKGSKAFNKYWSKNKKKFFSLSTDFLCLPCHPECLLNGAIRAAYANGLRAISKLHDDAYSGVLLYLSVKVGCTIAMEMFREDENSPAYQLLILACQQALLRAQDIVKQASTFYHEGSTDIKKIPKSIRNVIIRWINLKKLFKKGKHPFQLDALMKCTKLGLTATALTAQRVLFQHGQANLQLHAADECVKRGLTATALTAQSVLMSDLCEHGQANLQLHAADECKKRGLTATAFTAQSVLMTDKCEHGEANLQLDALKECEKLGLTATALTAQRVLFQHGQANLQLHAADECKKLGLTATALTAQSVLMTDQWAEEDHPLLLHAVNECEKLGITDEFGKPPTPTKAYSLLKQYEAFMKHLPAIRLLARDRRNWVDIGDGAGDVFRFSTGGENQQYVGTYEYINNELLYAPENDFRRKKWIDELNLRLDEWSTAKSEIDRKASNELVSQAKEIQDSQLTNGMVGTHIKTVGALLALVPS